ncbi:MAG TPA: tRNA-binding protein, partial [Lysobacter sp.]
MTDGSIDWTDFQRVDIRAGTVVRVESFPEARKPAWKLWVDFGELGVRQTSAQIVDLYDADAL